MNKLIIIITATLFITLTVKGQNLFFIGENSYPSTETIILQTNSDYPSKDLLVLFAKQGKMKNSNINTIRSTLKPSGQPVALGEGEFSASNRGTPTKTIITEFFN